jgi:IS605 OrfB family transposase
MNLDRMVLDDGKQFLMDQYHDSKRHLRDRMKRPNGPQLEKALKKKESDYGRDFVRKLASRIAMYLHRCDVSVLALEDLKNLTSDVRKAWTEKQKERNRRLKSSFPYAALRVALISACRKLGIAVKLIKPAYTSQECSRCGHVHKDNRTTQSRFACVKCGYKANADVNAAINIREKLLTLKVLRFRVPDSVPPGAAQLNVDSTGCCCPEVSML